MKRFFITSLAALLLCLYSAAATVSPRAARSIAANVLKGKSLNLPPEPMGMSHPGEDASKPYYIFNADGNQGYVIVAGDDRLPAVLGYSPDGSLSPSDMPPALSFLLEMSMRSAATSSAAEISGDAVPVVTPLLNDINWGQDTPFNTLCPTLSSGKKAYVGCVATAMAQMMRYYSYPERGTGAASYVDNKLPLSADFGSTVYDWANMPAIVPDTPSAQQTDAYSTLSFHLGVAVQMQYVAGGSGAYTHMVAPALRNYFGYSPSLRMHTREYYDSEEWMEMIRTELDASRPVYYSASSEDGAGGHAFVCDGYDSEGFVHINWGWYGRSNGYFYINHLNPGELGAGGGSGAYNISQEILTGFAPAAEGDIFTAPLYGATRLACDYFGSAMTLMTYVENLDTTPFDGFLCVVLTDTDGKNILTEIHSQTLSLGGFSSGRPAAEMITLRNVTTAADLPDGEYRIRLAYRSAATESAILLRHPVGLPAYATCTVRDKQIVNCGKHVPAPVVSITTPLAPDGEIFANGSARFAVELKNLSSDFRLSSLVLTLTNTEDTDMNVSATYPVSIYDLSAKNVIMDIDIPETLRPGKYQVSLAHTGFENTPFATFDGKPAIIEILPETFTPVLRFIAAPDPYNGTDASSEFKRGQIIYGNFSVKNYGAPGSSMLIMRAVSTGSPDFRPVIKAETRTWAKGEKATVQLSNALALDPGTYNCTFSYIDADGKEIGMDSDPVSITVSEADSPAVEVTEFTLPEVMKQRERYPYSITVKALRAVSGTLYIRMRQFTYTNGEIVTMSSGIRLNPGETKTITGNYSPSSTLADGMYLTMVEFKEGSITAPAAGHSGYYKEITLGDPAGVDDIQVDDTFDATSVRWFTIDGLEIPMPTLPGIYIRQTPAATTKILISNC